MKHWEHDQVGLSGSKRLGQYFQLPLLLGLIAMSLLLEVWHTLFLEPLPREVQTSLRHFLLVDTVIGIWGLALAVSLGMRANRQARHVKAINLNHHEAEAARQQIAAILQSNQARYEALVTNMPGVVYRYYPGTATQPHYFTYVSSYANELLELTPEGIVNDANRLVNLIHSEDLPSFVTSVANAVEHFLPWHWEGRITTPSGKLKWIEGNSQAQSTAEGAAWDGLLVDISDRKQAESDLRDQKEMLQTIINHIPVMVTLFDREGRIEFVNPELEKVLGWSLAEWQQHDILSFCYPKADDHQQVIDFMLAANGQWHDVVTMTASGQAIETSWANVRLSNGYYLGIGQDISDRKQKEIVLREAMEAAEAANLAKSMFLANMSHELRTPLNVILGFAQVMTHDPSLTPGQLKDLQTIQRSGDHLLSLINSVLDLSKIEAGHSTVDATGFDLIALLHTLRTMMTECARAKHLQLIFDIAPSVPQFVIGDEQKLRQVLLNLISNAIKFTQEGSITVQVQAVEGDRSVQGKWADTPVTLEFEVTDTGIGIVPDEQPLIFEAFMQAEAGKKAVSGTGLGLAISRKLLELMQGTITVHSIPQQGSTFQFTLPVLATSGTYGVLDRCDRRVIGLAPGQPQRRVLVVDDQPENRLLLIRLMTQLGLEVREACNGQEAIQIWQDWHPDLTWMDIRMPELDGYEATKRIRSMEPGHTSIIIALTAQASRSDRTLALTAGCNDYVSKPFREHTLVLKLQEYLGMKFIYQDLDSQNQSESVAEESRLTTSESLDESIKLAGLHNVSETWLAALEDAAICGNDQAIAYLVQQLPLDLAPFGAQVITFAIHFQFEKILELIEQVQKITK